MTGTSHGVGVELDKVQKRFGAATILHELSLSVNPGEFMVLVGPSGCGKSTALRLVAGLEEPTAGTVSIGGRVVNDVDPKDRGVAMVFQSYALYPHMSVRENLAFSLKLAGLAKSTIEERVREAVRALSLEEHLDRRPSQLSGGQKQRVAMGRAMVRHPKVFLFDEPLSNLDAQLRVKMRAEISLLHRKLRSTAIYVTHDQVEAMTLADRIAVMRGGRIEQVGPPLEVFHQPKTQFVASFIGTPSMNFVPADLLPRGAAPASAKTAGFRPESVRIDGKAAGVALGAASVALIEPLGTGAHVHLRLGEHALTAEARADAAPAAGKKVEASVEAKDLFFFDAEGARVA
ncbi:MAG TPA: sn-glycerol-3-phosphate ABC transporter ATP-binding protein UgpC [Elusimicrobiota bacterium]|jgi:ABC-type sugar transport system ATPase subunit|nr:sn-glycerol-3-phosphate ABC transporter ATP-binding protein UgpC [Elusimicrobiota bacterium]